MTLDLYKGKLCCHSCHHLINLEGEAKEDCPYCGKKLSREEQQYWAKEEEDRELRKRNFESNCEKGGLPDPETIYHDWCDRQQAAGRYPTYEEAKEVKKKIKEGTWFQIEPLPSLSFQKMNELYTKVAEAEARFSLKPKVLQVTVSDEIPEGEIWFLRKEEMNKDLYPWWKSRRIITEAEVIDNRAIWGTSILEQMKDDCLISKLDPEEEEEEKEVKKKYHFFFNGRWDGRERKK